MSSRKGGSLKQPPRFRCVDRMHDGGRSKPGLFPGQEGWSSAAGALSFLGLCSNYSRWAPTSVWVNLVPLHVCPSSHSLPSWDWRWPGFWVDDAFGQVSCLSIEDPSTPLPSPPKPSLEFQDCKWSHGWRHDFLNLLGAVRICLCKRRDIPSHWIGVSLCVPF